MKPTSIAALLFIAVLALAGCASAPPEAPEDNPPANIWTIGVYSGASPFELAPPPGVANPVLTAAAVSDLNVDIVAHPFLVAEGSRYYMFFTVKHGETETGGIGLAESADGLHWTYRQAVIKEPTVVSHPFVFEWQGDYYMVPETYKQPGVRLYKATSFPTDWQYQGTLLEGETLVSPTLLRHNDRWWLFGSPQGNRTLRLFHAADLDGEWAEHPRSPIVGDDPNIARPAGRPFEIGGSLYRLAQDCEPTYGNLVRAFRITELTPDAYADEMVETPLVEASGDGWNSRSMHHVDAHRVGPHNWIAAVDALGSPAP